MHDALNVEGLSVQIDGRQVLDRLNCSLPQGEIVLLTGHNGAGKTTLLQALLALIPRQSGVIWLGGDEVSKWSSAELVRGGLVMTQQLKPVFPNLTVDENLRISVVAERSFALSSIYELFPILHDRGGQAAGTLSGGQRQMLSLALALRSGPRVLLLDEPSVGLQPNLVGLVMETIRRLRDEYEISVLLVEQNIRQALSVADRVYVMSQGKMLLERTRSETTEDEIWRLL